jgi:DNA-binding response OmpR family regulator
MDDILKGKRVLIVDDELDILETLEDLLDICLIDTAPNFESARKFLDHTTYDVAILDIMGVGGYDLPELTRKKDIPALMLTAHALSPENLIKSIKGGAESYVPKDRMSEITAYLTDILSTREKGVKKHRNWFDKLEPFFDQTFGLDWKEEHKDFWKEFDQTYRTSQEELQKII